MTSTSLKAAVVTETYAPDVNGVAMTTSRLVDGLLDLGHRVQLVRPRRTAGEPPGDDGRLAVVPVAGWTLPGYREVKIGAPATSKLAALWRVDPPDIVHVVTEGPLGFSAVRAARRLGLPCCSDFHTNFHSYSAHYGAGLLARPLGAYLRWLHNRTDCTLVPTAAMVRELQAAGYRNVRVVARGVDTRLFDPARRSDALRAQWGVAPGELAVLHVGRLAAEKNLPLLMRAFEAMRSVRPNARLVVVGDGPRRAALQAAHPEHVYAGMQTGESLAACYASADVFVFPSLTETYGNVTVEAMASGLAMLAFDYAAAGEHIVHGVNGAVVAPGDEAAFIGRARTLAANPARLAGYGAKARRTAAALSWHGITLSLVDAYRDAIVRRPTGSSAGDSRLAAPIQIG